MIEHYAMPLAPGTKLGPYEIVSLLGSGGMGDVYRGFDPRLNREVALKVAHAQFNDRFKREANAIAALNHPNICHLYDVGSNYLVMELIEGPTLENRAPTPLDEALRIAALIAAALEAAHEKGIVHRDLKPANIKLTPDGVVKVLDFGLARLDVPEPEDVNNSPTLMGSPTQVGTILGTAAYMAPEQARGKVADKRADIWAFGVVLFELLTGERLFAGETVSDVLAGVLKSEPDLTRVPASVRRLLARCLQKDPKKRLRDIGDYAELLDAEVAPGPTPLPTNDNPLPIPFLSRDSYGAVAAAGIFALLFAALAFVHFRERPPQAPVIRSSILPPDKTSFNSLGQSAGPPELSPDGKRMVFSATAADGKFQLWVRSLDAPTAQPLAGTEGASFPFWSPDSQSIGFFSGGKLRKIAASGGPALMLADASNARGGTWSPGGVIVFAPNSVGPLYRISASGGAADAATALDAKDESSHRYPWFLPDGQHFLYKAGLANTGTKIRVGSLSGKDSRVIGESISNVVFSQGYLLFLRDATLMAQPLDPNTLKTMGEAVPVAEQVVFEPFTALGVFSASGTGLLAYQSGAAGGTQLIWFDRAGKRLGVLGEQARSFRLNFSPDRKNVAVSINDPASRNGDIWIYDIAHGLRTRYTFDPANENEAIWSPDGGTVVFDSLRKGRSDLYRKAANGSGGDILLYADDLFKIPTSWSPDGKFLLYHAPDTKTGNDLWILPNPLGPPGASKPYPFLKTQFNENWGQFSPDGKSIAYESDESGQFEIYVAPFPGPGGKRQISAGGGLFPRWRGDGREIFYISLNQRLMATDIVSGGNTLEVGQTHSLFGPVLANGYQYDVSADGQRFLVIASPQDAVSTPLTLLQNWTATLKK